MRLIILGVIETEPLVFKLIAFLCTNAGRLIGYDEIIDKAWNGRSCRMRL